MTLPLVTVDMRALAVAEKAYDIALSSLSSSLGRSTQAVAKIQTLLIEMIEAEHLRAPPASASSNQQKVEFSNEEMRRMADVAAQTQAKNAPMFVHPSAAEWAETVMMRTSPVRTVTRKEIAPGTYGKVIVGGHLTPGWIDIRWGAPGTTARELRAAAATLIELADALEEQGK